MGKRSKRSVLDGQGAKIVLRRRSRVPRNKYERIAEFECGTNYQMLRINDNAKTHQTGGSAAQARFIKVNLYSNIFNILN